LDEDYQECSDLLHHVGRPGADLVAFHLQDTLDVAAQIGLVDALAGQDSILLCGRFKFGVGKAHNDPNEAMIAGQMARLSK
jgi:hypothetical protein